MAILLISGFLGAMFIRYAPGFASDERVLDPRLSPQSVAALEHERAGERNLLSFYFEFLRGLAHGDLGQSAALGQPVAQLIRDRAPLTFFTVAEGWLGAWLAAVLCAAAGALSGRRIPNLVGMAASGSLLTIPSSLLAMVCLLLRLPPAMAISAVVFPRVFPHVHEQLRDAFSKPHVLMARSRGLSAGRLFLFHVVPVALAPILAIGGLSVTLAFGASIPVEALADSPGLGHLAWQAALGRDIPVLVTITLMLTAITIFANLLVDTVTARLGNKAA